jgi:hypothetical protein
LLFERSSQEQIINKPDLILLTSLLGIVSIVYFLKQFVLLETILTISDSRSIARALDLNGQVPVFIAVS